VTVKRFCMRILYKK